MSYATEVTLVSSRTDTAAASETAGTAITNMDLYRRGTFVLAITASSGTYTLDVVIQTYINGYWTDIARFTQMTATGTRFLWNVGVADRSTQKIIEEAQQLFDITPDDRDGVKRAGPWGTQLRASWTITVTGASITWECKGTVQA